jgi:hypothetical protein
MKATQATIQQRVEEILSIRLAGPQFVDIRQYVAEKEAEASPPWVIPEGGRTLSERTLWRYIQQTDRLIAESCQEGRKRVFRRHVAQRRHLYGLAVSQGDTRAALSCLRDEAELMGLYPPKGVNISGKDGGPVILNIREEIVGLPAPTALGSIVEEVVTTNGNNDSITTDRPPPSGAARLPSE